MMYTKSRSFFLLLILLSASFTHAKEEEKKQTIQEEITEYIYHHVQDSHDFSLFSTKDKETGKKKYYGFPLPVILIDDGIKFFMSSKLDSNCFFNVTKNQQIVVFFCKLKITFF